MTPRVHLIGIGGTGLSAIGRVLAEKGWQVSGSDRSVTPYLQDLEKLGVRIFIGHSAGNIQDVDIVVRSSAIPDDNVEVIAACEKNIPVQKRVDFLPSVIGDQTCIAIAGTHGKTTTTAMIAWILDQAGMDPSFIMGSVSKNLGCNARAGKGDFFVIEADEYDSMFLGLHPTIAVVTNVEHDHPDCYPTPQVYNQAFLNFLANLKPRGVILLCADHAGAINLRDRLSANKPVLTYSAYRLQDETPNSNQQNADYLLIENAETGYLLVQQEALHARKTLFPISLGVPGKHNLQNGMAAAIAALLAGVEPEVISRALASFSGTGRRFEIVGEIGDITLIDDYAHHPTEIRATIQAARAGFPDHRLWVVWQPHTYSRTQTLMHDYAREIAKADQLIVTEVFAARETSNGFSAEQILPLIPDTPAFFAPTLASAVEHLESNLRQGDVVLVLSAGDATRINQELIHSERINSSFRHVSEI
ncbi:MAG: UDP-N-acetylmuramate--L-alanine ligase [Leptolinea sp.]|jgi:UDP-N-acetylmuramate--alanine ligase|nr:UDP-N-acetylmuramate--L-alanine ligase [Leptolinea sp.]